MRLALPEMNRKKFIRILAITAGLLFAAYAVTYYFITQSEPFEETVVFVSASSLLKENVGEVQKVRLAPFGFSIEVVGGEGSADFECSVVGSKGSAEVRVFLKKESWKWRVVSASLVSPDGNISLQE